MLRCCRPNKRIFWLVSVVNGASYTSFCMQNTKESGTSDYICKGKISKCREVCDANTEQACKGGGNSKCEVLYQPERTGRGSNRKLKEVGGVHTLKLICKEGRVSQGETKEDTINIGYVQTCKERSSKQREPEVGEVGGVTRKRGLEGIGEDACSHPKKRKLDNLSVQEMDTTRTDTCNQSAIKEVWSQLPGRRVQVHQLWQLLRGVSERVAWLCNSDVCIVGKPPSLSLLTWALQLRQELSTIYFATHPSGRTDVKCLALL